jgi:hypothetical protein
MTLPTILVVIATAVFLILERVCPGRQLPVVRGWYWRAIFVNFAQLGITLATARLWIQFFDVSVFNLSAWNIPIAEGFVGWFDRDIFLLLVACAAAQKRILAGVPSSSPFAFTN